MTKHPLEILSENMGHKITFGMYLQFVRSTILIGSPKTWIGLIVKEVIEIAAVTFAITYFTTIGWVNALVYSIPISAFLFLLYMVFGWKMASYYMNKMTSNVHYDFK